MNSTKPGSDDDDDGHPELHVLAQLKETFSFAFLLLQQGFEIGGSEQSGPRVRVLTTAA